MIQQKIEIIKISDLVLWTENPRDPVDTNFSDYEIISKAILDENKKWDLKGLINKMGTHYDTSELPTVVKSNNKYIVYDGNRRIAVLKYLQNSELYHKLNGGLYFNEEPKELRELLEVPCNVCNRETALINIERKHVNSGSWTELDRDYFQYKHLKKEKSLFIAIEEQTGLISSNPKMGQRFVKEEVLTLENLNDIGFHYSKDYELLTNHDADTTKKIWSSIVDIVNNKVVSTRNNRMLLKEPLITQFPELKEVLNPYSSKNLQSNIVDLHHPKNEIKSEEQQSNQIKTVQTKRTPVTKPINIIFGKPLSLKEGKVNDLYRAICKIFESNKDDFSILPILGMSLRLITEVAARLYFDENNPTLAKKDQLYKEFLKLAKKEMSTNQIDKNFLSLTNEWLSNEENLEGVLAKYAHGNIPVNKDSIIKHSIIIGEILEHYFKK